ncbi:hypothetical protein Vretimale_1749 [Volvox reticuliferus]|uniref:Uncharacterized protein n=1 Tax=Volvox reticuliferus TaxID=1737510 RepID=A0A8J4FYL4_9CHLO|nr:hypothetical protein Vretifemale_15364 [Volvox reticuliferus]GIL95807.1 hypothetical protein Vretimale_1749 [Volvox reticuliferus]
MVLTWSSPWADSTRASLKAQYDFRLDEQDWEKVCWGRLPKAQARSAAHQLSRRAKWAAVLQRAATLEGGAWEAEFRPEDMTPQRLQALARVIDQEFFQGTFHREIARRTGRKLSYYSGDVAELYGDAVPYGDAVMAAPGKTIQGSGGDGVVSPPMARCTGGGCGRDCSLVPAAAAGGGGGRVVVANRRPLVLAASGRHSDIWKAVRTRPPECGTVSASAASPGAGTASHCPVADGGRRGWWRAWRRRGPGQGCTRGAVSGGASDPPRAADTGAAAPSATYQHSRGRVTFWRQVWSSYSPSVGRPMRLDGVVCTSRLSWLAHTLGHEMLHAMLFNMCEDFARQAPRNMSLEGHGHNFLMLNWYVLGHRGYTYNPRGWRPPPPLPCRL